MNILLRFCLALLPTVSIGQTIIDSTQSPSFHDRYVGGTFHNGLYVTGYLELANNSSQLHFFDDSLHQIQNLSFSKNGRDSLSIHLPFTVNGKLYVKAQGPGLQQLIFEVDNGNFIYQAQSEIDTLSATSLVIVEKTDTNRLRFIGYKLYAQPQYSIVIETDTNFSMLSYKAFRFDTLLGLSNNVISAYKEINDSTAHIFFRDIFMKYNLKRDTIDSLYYLRGSLYGKIEINSNEYLIAGEMYQPDENDTLLWAPIYGDDALGFYRMSHNGCPLDSVYIFHRVDSVPGGILSSSIRINGPAVLAYDSSSIFIGVAASYNPQGSVLPDEDYAWIVKLDSQGDVKWRFEFGGPNRSFVVSKLVPTPDKGCVAFCSFLNTGTIVGTALRIKLGPNGTLSDVEVLAPEDLVQFYPNPVRDVLHYTYLPPAKGHYSLQIFDLKGSSFGTSSLGSTGSAIPVQLPTGFYLYELTDENGKAVQVGKIVAE